MGGGMGRLRFRRTIAESGTRGCVSRELLRATSECSFRGRRDRFRRVREGRALPTLLLESLFVFEERRRRSIRRVCRERALGCGQVLSGCAYTGSSDFRARKLSSARYVGTPALVYSRDARGATNSRVIAVAQTRLTARLFGSIRARDAARA